MPKQLAHMAARGGDGGDGGDGGGGGGGGGGSGGGVGAAEKRGATKTMVVEPHYRETQARTAASGRGKSSPREMAFGRRRASITGRDSHLTIHQNLGARDYMGGGGVRSAEPTYNRVLPGAELDQEREAGRKSKKMKMKKKKTERKEEM